MILVLLQNAWSTHYTRIGRPGEEFPTFRARWEARVWDREAWLCATWSSRSGQQLDKILRGIPHDDLWLDDTTLEIADKPSGVKKPDLDHVRSVLAERDIRHVVACGKQSHRAIDAVGWDGPLVKIPHPAVRVLTNDVLEKYNTAIRVMLASNDIVRMTLDTYAKLITEEAA